MTAEERLKCTSVVKYEPRHKPIQCGEDLYELHFGEESDYVLICLKCDSANLLPDATKARIRGQG